MQHFHVLQVKYLGATNTRGSRVKITSDRFKISRTIPYDHALNSIEDMAVTAIKKEGFHVVGIAEGYIITDTFKPFEVT